MRKAMPEFAAIPLVLAGLGIVFAIFWTASGGAGRWALVGIAVAVVLAVVAVVLMRRPRSRAAAAGPFTEIAAPPRDGAHRVLVVADGICSADALGGLVDERTVAFVVAPALSGRLDRWTGDEHAYHDADEKLAVMVQALEHIGVQASGHVGAHDPLQATDDGLREFAADEIVFVTSDGDEDDWLESGVVDAARARYPIPVRAVAASGRSEG
jgi:hypothetical protein